MHQSPPKDDMDAMILQVIRQHPGRRLADIHYDPGTPGMDYQDTRSTLRRLVRTGKVRRTFCGRGWFVYYRYYMADGKESE